MLLILSRLVTTTSTVPGWCGGVLVWTRLSLTIFTSTASTPPKETVTVAPKLSPEISTSVSPSAGPRLGSMDLSCGDRELGVGAGLDVGVGAGVGAGFGATVVGESQATMPEIRIIMLGITRKNFFTIWASSNRLPSSMTLYRRGIAVNITEVQLNKTTERASGFTIWVQQSMNRL